MQLEEVVNVNVSEGERGVGGDERGEGREDECTEER